ncbi:hypothetical protein ACHAXT_005788 [Thalassiosira profunda]
MNPVCDGRVRPISKQATNQRVADREKHRINAHSLRLEIQSLNRKLKFDGLTDSERNDIREDVAKKQTTMKSKETRSQNVIQSNFEEKLVEELETTGAHARNDAGGAVLPVMTAEFQADAVIMGRLTSGDALMAVTDDADIPIIAGDGCVAVKGYMTDGSIQLVSTSRETLETMLELLSEAQKGLPEEQKANPTVTPAAHPLFEGVSDRKLRALIALFLGCDVYKGDVWCRRENNEESCPHATLFAYLKKYLYTYTEGFDGDVVHTYIRALVYEPTNVAPEDDEDPSRTYLDDTPPTKLPLYLEEFALNGYTDIVDGPEVGECKGVGMCTHKFLCADGFDKCVSCDGVICKLCRASIGERIHCLPCYAAELLVPEVDDEVGATSISQMRDELASKWGVERAKELTVDEVMDMYAKKEIASARLNGMLDDVPFPVYQSKELDAEVTEHWNTIVDDVNFGEGGAFLSDPDLDAKYLPGILEMFSSLVRLESTASTKWTDWVKDPVLYDSLPSLFVEFAAQSRLDEGFRLLKRCIRHSFDSRCKSMDTGMGSLVLDEDGGVGIRLGFDVPASMRKNIYRTEVVATANKLLGCKCTCQCGSQDEERIVCVHTLVVLYLLSILLMEDLAESMLIALASRITASANPNDDDASTANSNDGAEDLQWMWSMSNWTDGEISDMKESIVTLMEAAGEVVPEGDVQSKAIPELLQGFVVGTERRKAWKQKSKVPPKPSELGPVSDMRFTSTSQRAKKLTMRPTRPEKTDGSTQPPATANAPPSKCSLPNCAHSPNNHSQEMKECCGASCSRPVHPLCQQTFEQSEALIPEENRWWCCDCHPKNLRPPDYLKVASMMKAAGCEMDGSDIVGHRLLSMRAVKQMGDDFSQLNSAEKEAKRSWTQLKKMAEQRSTKMASISRANLKKRPHAEISPTPARATPRRTTGRRSVTPSPARRQPGAHRRSQQLPIRARATARRPTIPLRKRKCYRRCHMWEGMCPVNSTSHPSMSFHKVPKYPAELKAAKPPRDVVIRRYGKILLRQETLRRMGYKPDDRRQYFVCENHQFERTAKRIRVKYKEEPFERAFLLTVPHACGPESSLIESTGSKGTGRDRAVARIVNGMKEIVEDGYVPPELAVDEMERELESQSSKPSTTKEALCLTEEQLLLAQVERDRLKAELTAEKLARCQDWEQNSDEAHIAINPALKHASGLHLHGGLSYPDAASGRFFSGELQPLQNEKRPHSHSKDPPIVSLDMEPDQVKRRTGFPSMQHLLAYVKFVCNGDFAKMVERRTVLTWLEAWFMHFEYKWGRTFARKPDISAVYGPDPKYLRQEINLKYSMERHARNVWPTYVSYDEDVSLRDNEKWGRKYDGLRIVMWDMTNIPAFGFSDADFNRMTYSKYYNQNCFKGGVGNQLCGWIVVAPLWTGAVSDTMYNERAGYLQEQMEFQAVDLVNGHVVPWTNVYDKGYRAKMVAFRMGNQLVLQPVWAESDRRFGRDETLLTAAVAHVRGANERAVNVCKRSWFVSRGFRPNSSAKELNDAWMTWSFQCNFMFRPVL